MTQRPETWYKHINYLGCGSFGEVWQGEVWIRRIEKEELVNDRLALKFSYATVESYGVQQVIAAHDLIRDLQHPFLLGIHAYGNHGNKLWIDMELAECDLWVRCCDKMSQKLCCPPVKLAAHLRQAAEGLDFLHENGVVHCGVNPWDILVADNAAKVADFDLARTATDRSNANVSSYRIAACMAPECDSGEITRFSDQFALASTYAWLRLGRPLPRIEGHAQALARLPATERQALVKALAVDPQKRYRTCSEFAKILEWSVQ